MNIIPNLSHPPIILTTNLPEIYADMKLPTHLHLQLRLRMVELYFHYPVCLTGRVHNVELLSAS
jgi:hypothetical protein